MGRRVVMSLALVGLLACEGGHSPVKFVSAEQPNGNYNAQGPVSRNEAHRESPNGGESSRKRDLGEDDLVEPQHPVAETKQERALVHIHGPAGRVCSGVVIGPRIVATAQRCFRGMDKGVLSLGAEHEFRVEVASSAATWTSRRAKYAVVPNCEEQAMDVALIVLEEPVPALVVPLTLVSAPDVGAHVQALGYGHCAGSKEHMTDRVGSVRSLDSDNVVIDVPLCRGDVGGPVIDGNAGAVLGVISHRDNPVDSPLKTTAIARLDTTNVRDLIAQAKTLADGGDSTKLTAVACR